MAARNSQQDSDGITWQTAAIPLGTTGLDLRTPIEADALAELLNARFQDARTVCQRDGHDSLTIYDGSDLALFGDTFYVTGDWVFGHGATVGG